MNDAVPRRLVLSVATLSGGVLANEILLTRLFVDRLDEIVVELAGLYGGVLSLGTAPIGGLRAELALPGA